LRSLKECGLGERLLMISTAQLDRFCEGLLTFYNRDRFHSAFDGRTPDEVYFARPKRKRPLGRVTNFDGPLNWYRFRRRRRGCRSGASSLKVSKLSAQVQGRPARSRRAK